MKHLGVLFDSKLSFTSHCREKINIAYSMLRLIKCNFMYLTEDAARYTISKSSQVSFRIR